MLTAFFYLLGASIIVSAANGFDKASVKFDHAGVLLFGAVLVGSLKAIALILFLIGARMVLAWAP